MSRKVIPIICPSMLFGSSFWNSYQPSHWTRFFLYLANSLGFNTSQFSTGGGGAWGSDTCNPNFDDIDSAPHLTCPAYLPSKACSAAPFASAKLLKRSKLLSRSWSASSSVICDVVAWILPSPSNRAGHFVVAFMRL